MKLLNELTNLIVEKPMKWYDVALASADIDDISEILRINFNNNYPAMLNMLEIKGLGYEFLNRIVYHWDENDMDLIIFTFLGGMLAYRNGSIDNDDFDEFIVYPAIDRISTMSYTDEGKILYELMDGEEVNFFSDNAKHIAKMVFTDGFEPMMVDYDTHESVEDLVNLLSQPNYIELVRFVTINWENKVVHSGREEFESWVEDDNVGDDGFLIMPWRMNHYLTNDDRYNFIVLLSETDEFNDLVLQIKDIYNRTWSDIVESQYYREYYKALKEYLGDVVSEGTTWTYGNDGKMSVPTKIYDITNTIRDVFAEWIHHHGNIDENELYHLIVDGPDLEPYVNEEPDDDQEVLDTFNENFNESLY